MGITLENQCLLAFIMLWTCPSVRRSQISLPFKVLGQYYYPPCGLPSTGVGYELFCESLDLAETKVAVAWTANHVSQTEIMIVSKIRLSGLSLSSP